MNKLDKSDLLSLEEYSSIREQTKKKELAIKKNRRIHIGGNVSLLFENSDTIKYQLQKMLRIEKIIEPSRIEEELFFYNSLIPNGSNLKATMLIEFPNQEVTREKLSQLIGIEDKVWLKVGENDRVFGITDENLNRKTEDETSAEHFLRFELSNLITKDLKSGDTLFAGIDHQNYNVRTQEISQSISDSLSKGVDNILFKSSSGISN